MKPLECERKKWIVKRCFSRGKTTMPFDDMRTAQLDIIASTLKTRQKHL